MRILIVLPLLVALGTSTANAQAPGLTPTQVTSEPVTVETRYGWQLLLGDLAWIAASVATEEEVVSVGMYLGVAPAIHLAHGNPGRAMGSVALRASLPFAGAMIGLQMDSANCDDEYFCGLGGLLLGGLLGVMSASAIDAGLLAKKSRRVERPRGVLQLGGISANPGLAPTANRGLSLGLSGTF